MNAVAHIHPPDTPDTNGRDHFLVDGCPRCVEYVEDMGVHFDAERFRAFWAHMTRVEWDDADHYRSLLDKQLGTRLYFVSLTFQRAFGIHPSNLSEIGRAFNPFIEVTDPRD